MSVTAAQGYVAAGVAAGVKASGDLDLSLVATDDGRPVVAAATFTSNKATAAPVQVSRRHLGASGGRAAAVILNSGNANAATGAAGIEAAERMCAGAAHLVGCNPEHVLVCSTGLIGIPLPIEVIEKALPALAEARSSDGGEAAARAIMTTDTQPKQVVIEGDGFVVGGMAKGAAMLAPNMATMLAVLTTDADVDADVLQAALRGAVAESFNKLSVDGCTSTNDTVIVLANGRGSRPSHDAIAAALTEACQDLAAQMAGDAEGATKVVRITVQGAASTEDAAAGARNIADSQLTKCSWYGQDPYWGRIASDLGSAGIEFDLDRLSVSYGGLQVCRGGVTIDHDADAVREHMAGRHVDIVCDLGVGGASDWILTNDLTHAYVDENMGTS
ncbi:MAG TPA: bifunctional glutamate N-acetyltransferase/amino-acid acetyltransferase ArgJ [Acidimicrobiales bacterium]|nr:bifunctional glutamate N-acetyltransferase/amino-acid acetyltransferase ArgJ [Acidimicrobiales bacterium]